MLTKKVKKRALIISLLTFIVLISISYILVSLNKNILYFKSPTEIHLSQEIDIKKKIRIGGMVKKDSVSIEGDEIKFVITDLKNEIIVSYSGTVPNLFSEDKGVVAEGKLKDKNFFIATRIVAKHDENYMPPEVKESLKENAK